MKKIRAGFTLIETMVAMTMFGVVMLGMARMAAAVAVKGRTNDVVAQRNAVLQLEANKMGAVPFARLASWPDSSRTMQRGNFSFTRRTTLTATSTTRYTIKIVIIPTADPTKKDSVTIERTRPPQSSPLCVGC